MKRARGDGATLLSGEFVRFVDLWRKAAARPLKTIRIDSTHRPGMPFADAVWTLEEEGKLIARWREGDLPGFADWLKERLYELQGAWHIARTELGVVKKRKAGGARTASDRKAKAERRNDTLTAAARKLKKENPRLTISDLARHLSDRDHGGVESLRKKLPKLLRK